MKYIVCEKCGAHLDHGEKCSCKKASVQKTFEAFKIRDSSSYLMTAGGGRVTTTSVGRAVVLTGKRGEPLKGYPCKNEVNGIHALCRVEIGCHIVTAKEHVFGYPRVQIYRIERFETDENGSRALCKEYITNTTEKPIFL